MNHGLVVAGLVAIATPALADRSTIATIGVTGDARASGPSYSVAAADNTKALVGARVALAWEDAPLPIPPPTLFASDVRLVPELLAGFVADDVHAEGMLGAGLRGEVQLASNRHGVAMRTGLYTAGRAMIIGRHRDAAGEFVIGEYLMFGARTRFGWEGGAMVRPKPWAKPERAHEVDAVLTVYVGWPL